MIMKRFQHIKPAGGCAVAYLKVFTDGIYRQQRADLVRQQVAQQFHVRQVAYQRHVLDVFTEQPFILLIMPAAQKARVLFKKRLREPAKAHEPFKLCCMISMPDSNL